MIFVGDATTTYKPMQRNAGFGGLHIYRAVYDRELLRAYYTLANMFLFPLHMIQTASWYRSGNLRLSQPSDKKQLCRGPVVHMETALLADENAVDLAEAILFACDNRHIETYR